MACLEQNLPYWHFAHNCHMDFRVIDSRPLFKPQLRLPPFGRKESTSRLMCLVDSYFIYADISLLAITLTVYPTDVDVPFINSRCLLSCGIFTTLCAERPKSRGSIPYRGKRSCFPPEHANLLWFPRNLLYSYCT